MTEARSKQEVLSETCITHLVDVYIAEKYQRNTDINNKYIEKGLQVEEDSITLYSRVKKVFFKKNEAHLNNEFIKGTPDLYKGETINTATEIIDIKSAWDIYTFFRAKHKSPKKLYYWQLQGYMALTGAKIATLAYCLIDTPPALIYDEKRRLMWKMNILSENDPDYIAACEEIDRAMTYPDIPLHERMFEIEIIRNDADIEAIYERVKKCREYMQKNLLKTL